jgi:hypothetical protein
MHHKKFCGKEKVTKELQGTIRDPHWQFPGLPDHLRAALPNGSNHVSLDTIGFGTPHPSHPHNQALQRQVSLLTGDTNADYFLFNSIDHPIRFVIQDTLTRMVFRICRADAMFGPEQQGLEAIAEYMIKMMERTPGLSRERILEQLSGEYGGDVGAKVREFQKMSFVNGHGDGTTFLEVMGKNVLSTAPGVLGLRK